MRKILIIARREYIAMVGTKAFLIGMAMMPILMLGGAVVPQLLRGRVDLDPKKIIVLDSDGVVFAALDAAANIRNEQGIFDEKTKKQVEAAYELKHNKGPVTDDLRVELSERIRDGKLYAFVEIPENVFEVPSDGNVPEVVFYADNTALSPAKRWLEQTMRAIVQTKRLQDNGIDPLLVQPSTVMKVKASGLYDRSASGKIEGAETQNELTAIFLPMGIMMFMFMMIMMSAQPMLESVLEEKTMRIAEVLLGSASPTQLMYGKLLGIVGGSLTVVMIYLAGAIGLAVYNDMTDALPLHILPWFIVFQLFAVLMFSSFFLAIGASVNHLKEAQGLLMPVWFLIVTPMFVWLNVVREPTGSLATVMSFIPVFTPMLMTLRMAASSAIPWWQPPVGVVVLMLTTMICVFAAGRVFRIALLMQGKAPKMTQLMRWAIRG